jgi:hypothetical protein
MEPTQSSETLAYKIQTPGKFPEDYILYSQHGESLKTTSEIYFKHENSRMEESDSTRDKIDSLRAT